MMCITIFPSLTGTKATGSKRAITLVNGIKGSGDFNDVTGRV
jgi:hypothetical protein